MVADVVVELIVPLGEMLGGRPATARYVDPIGLPATQSNARVEHRDDQWTMAPVANNFDRRTGRKAERHEPPNQTMSPLEANHRAPFSHRKIR